MRRGSFICKSASRCKQRALPTANLLTLIASALLTSVVFAAPTAWRDNANGLALGGYDPVAYHVDAAPRRGMRDQEYTWRGVVFRFVNEGNLGAFKRNPEVYAPRFAGYVCSIWRKGWWWRASLKSGPYVAGRFTSSTAWKIATAGCETPRASSPAPRRNGSASPIRSPNCPAVEAASSRKVRSGFRIR